LLVDINENSAFQAPISLRCKQLAPRAKGWQRIADEFYAKAMEIGKMLLDEDNVIVSIKKRYL